MTESPEFDPTALDGFTSVEGSVCPETLSVYLDPVGPPMELACEVDGEHDEHEATLRWLPPAESPRALEIES